MAMRSDTRAQVRADYVHYLAIPTRWNDNDSYGHVNNVVYYEYFDTVINEYLIHRGGLDINHGDVIGVAVESMCRFHRSFTFPEVIDAGLRVPMLGRSSVRYEIGLFRQGKREASAVGHFVHVFVDRNTRRPLEIPAQIREALSRLMPAEPAHGEGA
jgi:acyl-CoA thioester hydrolase